MGRKHRFVIYPRKIGDLSRILDALGIDDFEGYVVKDSGKPELLGHLSAYETFTVYDDRIEVVMEIPEKPDYLRNKLKKSGHRLRKHLEEYNIPFDTDFLF